MNKIINKINPLMIEKNERNGYFTNDKAENEVVGMLTWFWWCCFTADSFTWHVLFHCEPWCLYFHTKIKDYFANWNIKLMKSYPQRIRL